MARSCLLLVLVFLGALSSASTVYPVKINSAKFSSPDRLAGSGILLKNENEIYVLTSEHVSYHLNEGAAHMALTPDGQRLQLEYKISEWSNGLALLRVKNPDSITYQDVLDIQNFSCAKPNLGESVVLKGYPAKSTGLLEDAGGVLKNDRVPSRLLLTVSEVLLVEGAHAEFGMSGGPILNSKGELLGMISHKKSIDEESVWGIPCELEKKWLQEAMKPGAKSLFYRESGISNTILTGRLSVDYSEYYKEIRFYEVRPEQKAEAFTNVLDHPLLKKIQAYTDGGGRSYPNAVISGFTSDPLESYEKRMIRPENLIEGLRQLLFTNLRPYLYLDYQGQNTRIIISNAYYDFRYNGGPIPQQINRPLEVIRNLIKRDNEGNPSYGPYNISYLKLQDFDDLLSLEAWKSWQRSDPESAANLKKNIENLRKSLSALLL